MIIGATNCLVVGELEAFSSGCLTEDDADAIAAHLSHCSRCVAALEQLSPSDTLIDAFRAQTLQNLPLSNGDRIQQIIQAAKQLYDSSNQSAAYSAKKRVPAYEIDALQQLGEFRIVKLLGQGGMGAVFEAEDLQLQRRVAVKALLPQHAANPQARARFLREARSIARLEHENIVPVLLIGEDKGVPYFVMPLLAGESLESKRRRQGKLNLHEILRIGIAVADGLEASHRRGIVHRDVKPENVWLESKGSRPLPDFQVKILDFGLAYNEQQDIHLTQEGMLIGTPAYMAPEQANGLPADVRSDFFSLGTVLYVLASGKLPFAGPNAITTLRAVAQQPAQPLGELCPDLPKALVAVIEKLHAKDPAQRFAAAADVAVELRRIAAGAFLPLPDRAGEGSRTVETRDDAQRVRYSRRKLASAFLVIVLIGLGVCEAAGITRIRGVFKADPSTVVTEPRAPEVTSAPAADEAPLATHAPGPDKNLPLEFKAKSPVERIVPIPESSAVLYVCRDDATLYGVNERGTTVEIGHHDGPIRALCCSPDGSRAVTGGDDGMVRVWSLADARARDALTGPEGNYLRISGFVAPYAIVRSQDGLTVFDEANNKKEVFQFGKPGHRALWGFKRALEQDPKYAQHTGAALNDAVWAFDRALTLQMFEGGTLLCEMKSGRISKTTNAPGAPPLRQPPLSRFKSFDAVKQHSAPVTACAISPDGGRAVSIGADSLLCEWNIKDGTLIRKFSIPASLAVAYLIDGNSVLLGTSNESAIIVDLDKQKRVQNLTGHKGKVNAVATTSKYLYTAGDDCTIRIWDVPTRALFRLAIKHKSPVLTLNPMLNDEFLASTSGDGQIYFWDAMYIVGRPVGECVVNEKVHTVGFNELSDHLVLGMAADDGAGAVRYVRLQFENDPPTLTIDLPDNVRAAKAR